MQSLSHLTNDELINQVLMHNDLTPLERELLHSVDVAACHFEAGGRRVHLLDTPGYPDLLGRSLAALAAAAVAVADRFCQTAASVVRDRSPPKRPTGWGCRCRWWQSAYWC